MKVKLDPSRQANAVDQDVFDDVQDSNLIKSMSSDKP